MKPLETLTSALFIPANRDDFIAKAHSRGASAIILDLEDSIAEDCKQAARENVKAASETIASQGVYVLVRINSSWRQAVRDLEASIGNHVHAIVIPKASSAEHVQAVAEVVTELEAERGMTIGHTRLLAYIESAAALKNAPAIAAASPRVFALSLGTEDFSVDIGALPNRQTLYRPCQDIVYAACAAGVQPLGFAASIAAFSDMDSFREVISLSRDMGFRGACCIHPKQVEVLNQGFLPTAPEVAHAQAIVDCFDSAVAQGLGAVAYQGEMIDAPVYARAQAVLAAVESSRKGRASAL